MTGDTDATFRLVDSFAEAWAFMRWLGERRQVDAIGVDTETGGLDWWRQPARTVQFADERVGWVVPVGEWTGLIREVFARFLGSFVFFNANFDLHVLGRLGVVPPMWTNVEDVMIAARLADSTRRSIALKPLAADILATQAARQGETQLKTAMRKQGWTWENVPLELPSYWAYAALDAVLTVRVWNRLQERLAVGRIRDAYELEMACLPILRRMEEGGIRCDEPYCQARITARQREIDTLREWAEREYGVNLLSNQQLSRRLLADGVRVTKRTPTGAPSVDEEVLRSIDHPLGQAALRIREARKVIGTWFQPFLDTLDGELIHPSIHPVGTRTGRHSCTHPPMQTLPRGPEVRDAFVARDGHRLVLADFDQMELRVFASYAQEPGMLAAIRAGEDLHSFVARSVFHIPDGEDVPRPRRSIAKNANFARVYCAGTKKFAKTAGIPLAEGETFMAVYDDRFPRVKAFQQTVDRIAGERFLREGEAYVTTPAGRRLIAPQGYEYRLVNYCVQGACADVFKRKLVELDASGLGELIVLPVHDEVIFDVPLEDVEEVKQTVKQVMTERDMFAVPLEVGVKVVDRWGEGAS